MLIQSIHNRPWRSAAEAWAARCGAFVEQLRIVLYDPEESQERDLYQSLMQAQFNPDQDSSGSGRFFS